MRRKYQNGVGELFSTNFKTSLGYCSAVFDQKGKLVRFSLPASKETSKVYIKNFQQKHVKLFENKVKKYFKKDKIDFSDVRISLEVETVFRKRVYTALRKVKSGSWVTYGELASMAGFPSAARAVGTAVARNPIPLIIPCHRVLPASGQIGRFSADGGIAMKCKMLEIEGVKVKE